MTGSLHIFWSLGFWYEATKVIVHVFQKRSGKIQICYQINMTADIGNFDQKFKLPKYAMNRALNWILPI